VKLPSVAGTSATILRNPLSLFQLLSANLGSLSVSMGNGQYGINHASFFRSEEEMRRACRGILWRPFVSTTSQMIPLSVTAAAANLQAPTLTSPEDV
jgi:hypothetical protein